MNRMSSSETDGKRMIMVLAPAKQQLVKPERKPAEESLDAEVKNA